MRTLAVLLLVVCACKGEPPPVERLQATPDKSQPAVAMVPLADQQQVRPKQVVLQPTAEKALPDDFGMIADPLSRPENGLFEEKVEYADAPRALLDRVRNGLAVLHPGLVFKAAPAGDGQTVELTGRAMSHEAVAALMRSLSTRVMTPRGLALVVERSHSATVLRVEVLGPPRAVVEYSVSEIQSLSVELRDAALQKNGEVSFRMTVREKQPVQ